jgi:hypothetical protein
MADGLTAEELAFMRETQADHRPTEATLSRRVSERAADGGQVDDWTEGDLVAVRLNTAPDKVPEALASRYGLAGLVHCSMDLVHDVRAGDRLEVTPAEVYEVVTEGEPDAWTTAQIVWLNRITYPSRA